VIINGEELNFSENLTVSELLAKLNLDSNKVVVEVDLEIIGKEEYSSRNLSSDSKVEIIRFVGGG
jgi:sulfur carrier protein